MLKNINGLIYSYVGVWTEEEQEYYDKLEDQWKASLRPAPGMFKLLETYPQATKYVKMNLTELTAKLNDLYASRRNVENFLTNPNNVDYNDQWFWLEVARTVLFPEIPVLEKQIKRTAIALSLHAADVRGENGTGDRITQADIENAKEVPIDTFIEFNRAGFARCIQHDERTGSMKYYRNVNRVYCFGCNFNEDSIGVVMKMRNAPFTEAVRFLISK